MDYLLKPVQPARLEKTVHKLRQALQRGAASAPEDTFAQLRALLHTPGLGAAPWFDKVPLKTTGWDAARCLACCIRSDV